MPSPTYLTTALAIAVAITITLRAVPFVLKNAMGGSALLTDIGRWMPLGAVTILAVYCLAQIPVTAPTHGVPELVGVVVTIFMHRWRRNAALSIVTGTAACLVVNWVMPI